MFVFSALSKPLPRARWYALIFTIIALRAFACSGPDIPVAGSENYFPLAYGDHPTSEQLMTLGRKIFLAKAPTRVISLAPSITEILYAIGLSDEIVGVTEFCDYPPAALQKPKIGYAQPNIEAIVALQPDLVLAPRAFLRADLLAKLEQLKIPTFVVDPEGVPPQRAAEITDGLRQVLGQEAMAAGPVAEPYVHATVEGNPAVHRLPVEHEHNGLQRPHPTGF